MSDTLRQNFATGTPWEPIVGYSRAVRVGNHVCGIGHDGHGCERAWSWASATPMRRRRRPSPTSNPRSSERAPVSRTSCARASTSPTSGNGRQSARAHGEAFRDIRPACTMVEVATLISPEILVEIEADAIVGS